VNPRPKRDLQHSLHNLQKWQALAGCVDTTIASPCLLFRHENLEVVKGDACDLDSFERVLADKDAVLSCLGSKNTKGPFAFTTLYSDTIKNIIEAMKR
jgi:putative NADH-flavin reductase